MAFLGLKYREDKLFAAAIVAALVGGALAGAYLTIPFLAVSSMLLLVVWVGDFLYHATGRPGVFATALIFSIPIFLVAVWLCVVVTLWGFLR